MKSNVDRTHIANTLSYIHLLPIEEQLEHCNKILDYFKTNSIRNRTCEGELKLIKKAIYFIGKNIYV